ncbi:hypothetical protein B0H67DRAFT_98018 [Lasiosphaeris hirsuta]|uniref:Uncharacterized protein n=1 Tax=Lasiosphaeris hirsuta TaxID=260670 RepID=A0AA39ZPJ9_9PEZI|nr:hypothetical protein B0H67DRAFT_98018 [Lasiosphaeris hirsuta]
MDVVTEYTHRSLTYNADKLMRFGGPLELGHLHSETLTRLAFGSPISHWDCCGKPHHRIQSLRLRQNNIYAVMVLGQCRRPGRPLRTHVYRD